MLTRTTDAKPARPHDPPAGRLAVTRTVHQRGFVLFERAEEQLAYYKRITGARREEEAKIKTIRFGTPEPQDLPIDERRRIGATIVNGTLSAHAMELVLHERGRVSLRRTEEPPTVSILFCGPGGGNPAQQKQIELRLVMRSILAELSELGLDLSIVKGPPMLLELRDTA